jgi:acetyltransferase-like isoleucine patch superfamily enzyme
MSFIHRLVDFYRLFSQGIRRITVFLKYDDFNIAEYYRKEGAKIGENCEIHIRSKWNEPELVQIGNHVLIAQGVIFHTHDGGVWILREQFPSMKILGKIVIGDNCLIGANAQIFEDVRIGNNCIIGAGSIVISDVPPNSIVMGIPARVIGSTLKYKEKHIAMWNKEMTRGAASPTSKIE